MVRVSAPGGSAASSGVRTACTLAGESGAGDIGADAEVPNAAREGSVSGSATYSTRTARKAMKAEKHVLVGAADLMS